MAFLCFFTIFGEKSKWQQKWPWQTSTSKMGNTFKILNFEGSRINRGKWKINAKKNNLNFLFIFLMCADKTHAHFNKQLLCAIHVGSSFLTGIYFTFPQNRSDQLCTDPNNLFALFENCGGTSAGQLLSPPMATVPLLVREHQLHVYGANVEPFCQGAIVVVAGGNLPRCAPLTGPMLVHAIVVDFQEHLQLRQFMEWFDLKRIYE